MEIIIRLAIGLFVLISATFMTMIFGVGGFLFTVGFFGVIWFAFAG